MTAEQAMRISLLCDRFEWDWRKGASPRIELALSDTLPEDRPALLEDLLRIELELRRAVGDHPCAEDYLDRFPAESELINRVLREAASDEDEPLRQFVGRYELFEEIGRGREGVVYRAREEGIVPLEVAVKVLAAGAVGSREDALRFINEVRSMASFNHENIVPYLGSGDDRGRLYYVMRCMRGPNLDRFLADRGEPLDPVDAARLMIQIVEAVRYLHDRRPPSVHRDLKPRNILMDEAGKPYVADFGLTLLLDEAGGEMEGGACGTIPYIAPEQFDRRFGELGSSSDIYSLGVILYELITGRPPFPSTRESILRTLDTDPPPPSRLRAGIPDDLERICLKCLQKMTRDRYASAGALAAELRRFVQNEPLVETPPQAALQHLRHWARSEPALAARLSVIIACSAILWGFRLIAGRYAPLPTDHWAGRSEVAVVLRTFGPLETVLVWMNQVILAAWGLASWAFQRRLSRSGRAGGPQLGWRIVNVAASL